MSELHVDMQSVDMQLAVGSIIIMQICLRQPADKPSMHSACVCVLMIKGAGLPCRTGSNSQR